jgi:hypothetical protein
MFKVYTIVRCLSCWPFLLWAVVCSTPTGGVYLFVCYFYLFGFLESSANAMWRGVPPHFKWREMYWCLGPLFSRNLGLFAYAEKTS